jgi:hypothetical protein
MALVESITWDSEPKNSLMYVKDRSVLRYKFKQSLCQTRKAYRRTEKVQRIHCYHHCCQRLGSSGFCTDEEIDINSNVIGDWSVCP